MKLPYRAHSPKPRASTEASKAPAKPTPEAPAAPRSADAATAEIGGREGPEPTRYGDWEVKGRCIDF
jgi:hypothetical protein